MTFRRFLLAALLAAHPHLYGQNSWHDQLVHTLGLMGRHNWIVVGEPAFPLINEPGMATVTTELSQTDLLTAVLEAISRAGNVRPIFYTDAELPYISEQDAIGVGAYRAQLAGLLKGGQVVATLPQEQILGTLEDASRSYRTLVLKSTTRLPYSTVFIELESGYWPADAEKRVRAAMGRQ
jgi:hypothetical protein